MTSNHRSRPKAAVTATAAPAGKDHLDNDTRARANGPRSPEWSSGKLCRSRSAGQGLRGSRTPASTVGWRAGWHETLETQVTVTVTVPVVVSPYGFSLHGIPET